MKSPFLILIGIAVLTTLGLSSCCEPKQKDSKPLVIDSLFQETSGYSLDLFQTGTGSRPDSGYFPIYTFAIKNTGTDDDDYTVRIRVNELFGFDVRKHVPAGTIGYFRTPTPIPDSFTTGATYTRYRPDLVETDSLPLMSDFYYRFFRKSTDSVSIRVLRPDVRISSGSVDNGPEGCNSPAMETEVDVSRLGQ
jgi:hypothetical protein